MSSPCFEPFNGFPLYFKCNPKDFQWPRSPKSGPYPPLQSHVVPFSSLMSYFSNSLALQSQGFCACYFLIQEHTRSCSPYIFQFKCHCVESPCPIVPWTHYSLAQTICLCKCLLPSLNS